MKKEQSENEKLNYTGKLIFPSNFNEENFIDYLNNSDFINKCFKQLNNIYPKIKLISYQSYYKELSTSNLHDNNYYYDSKVSELKRLIYDLTREIIRYQISHFEIFKFSNDFINAKKRSNDELIKFLMQTQLSHKK